MLGINKHKVLISTINSIIIVVSFVFLMGSVFNSFGFEIFGFKNVIAPGNSGDDIVQKIYFGNNYIQINNPQKNSIIQNPILISGRASVFESVLRMTIKDGTGNVLADEISNSNYAVNNFYFFNQKINYNIPNSKDGTIEILKEGDLSHRVVIPIFFENYKNK